MTSPPRNAGLVRQLGIVSATALVISNMVGTGIFTTSGFLAGDLGSPSLLLLIWVLGAFVALAGAFCYSELGINFPSSGGEYVYLTRAYGPTWGFMTGWVSFFAGFSAPIAAASLAFSDYLGYFAPAIRQENAAFTFGSEHFLMRIGGAQMAASALIALFTIVNCFGLKRSTRIQNALTAAKVAVILAFVGFGLLFGQGDWSHFSQHATRTSVIPIARQFAVSLFWISISYSGWNAATYVAEEVKSPSRTLPIALAFGTGLVATLYVALNVVFIYGAPLEEMKGVIAIGSLTASKLFGREIGGAFSLLMALSLASTVSAMVTIGPRLYYAMARNGAFFSIAARVNERRHAPVVAIACQGVCAILMTLTPFPQLVYYIAFTLNFFTALSVASLFRFRRRPDWRKVRVVSFAFPLVPVFFLAVSAWMIVYGVTLQPAVSFCSILTIAAGAAVYQMRLRSGSRTPGPAALDRA